MSKAELEQKIPFNELSVDHGIEVFPHWNVTSHNVKRVGDFTLALDVDGRGHADGQDLQINVYAHNKNLVRFGELRDGRWTNELLLPNPETVTLKPDGLNSKNGGIIFDSQDFTYAISRGGLVHTILDNRSGRNVVSLYYDHLVSERSVTRRIREGKLTDQDTWEIDRNYRERNKKSE